MVNGGAVGGVSADEPTWRMSKRCETGACVMIGIQGESVLVCSSADPGGACLTLGRDRWQEFIAELKRGKFDGL
jgi:Domain of unknown function (DUF397)